MKRRNYQKRLKSLLTWYVGISVGLELGLAVVGDTDGALEGGAVGYDKVSARNVDVV